MILVQSVLRTYQESSLRVFLQTMYEVVPNAQAVVFILLEYLKVLAVKAVQSIIRTEPHESLLVLHDGPHAVMRKPIFYLIAPEIVCACIVG